MNTWCRMRRLLTALSGIWVLAAMSPAHAEPLPVSEWIPVEIHGLPFAPPPEAFVRFGEDGRYFGNGGCNTMRGGFTTNEDAILLSPAAMTMMACADEINRQEYAFTRALSSVRFYARDGSTLRLKDGGSVVIMRLEQREPN